MNIPNLLTLLRVLLIPIFILLFYLPTSWSY
ncbi:CDP-alcohol phosphatidyltransferase family protein, partial [Pseudomonas aeruginosa]